MPPSQRHLRIGLRNRLSRFNSERGYQFSLSWWLQAHPSEGRGTLRSMKTKCCSTCKRRRLVKFFTRNSSKRDGLNYSCVDCQRAYTREHYRNNKKYYVDKAGAYQDDVRRMVQKAKAVPCKDCGVSYPYYVMDFDHVCGKKVAQVANMVARSASRKSILAEMAKCEVVCANCHRERTHGTSP